MDVEVGGFEVGGFAVAVDDFCAVEVLVGEISCVGAEEDGDDGEDCCADDPWGVVSDDSDGDEC